jgi:phosphate starvation-inducible protein PhoH and related proteins
MVEIRPMGKRRRPYEAEDVRDYDDRPVAATTRKTLALRAKTPGQSGYIQSITSKVLVFGVGPAGTGKSYIATVMAADALKAGLIERIIITRPAVEAGEKLGFLPGLLEEKFDPFFRPIRDILDKRLGASAVENLVKNRKIEACPLAFMRGMTLDYCWVIGDEMQNTTPTQMKMFLTRIGEGTKYIVNGDPRQIDLPDGQKSGLMDAVDKMDGHPDVGIVRFTDEDVVRSGIAQDIVKRYENKVEEVVGFTEVPRFMRR